MTPSSHLPRPDDRTVYRDNRFDRLFIWLFSRKMARVVGQISVRPGYEGFVDLSERIMAGRPPQEQQTLVAMVLRSLVPGPVLILIRRLFAPGQRVCELNAWFATQLFEWLVGPCEVREVEVPDSQGQLRRQYSGVHIEKCRYLEATGCVAMCVNLCKVPTQDFFTRDFGIPLTLTPNFEDLSCDMVFGQPPPPLVSEAVYQQPCLTQRCSTAASSRRPCPGVRLDQPHQ